MWVNVNPLVCSPESQRPELLVVECEVRPDAQFHLTWSFRFIATAGGLNAKLTTLTFVVEAAAETQPAATVLAMARSIRAAHW